MKTAKAPYLVCLLMTAWLPSFTQAEVINETADAHLTLVNFTMENDTRGWEVQDDVVMGGRSVGSFAINRDGHGVFSGKVSLENNGGFSSIQHNFDAIDVSAYTTACIRIKGDGKRYQFRVKSSNRERWSYLYEFETSDAWQTIEIPLAEMYPSFRGNRLTLPNYPGLTMAHMRFLIGNKTAESFELQIDKIWLK